MHFVLAQQVQHRLVGQHHPAQLLGQRRGRPPALPALAWVWEGVALQQGRQRHVQTLPGRQKELSADGSTTLLSLFVRLLFAGAASNAPPPSVLRLRARRGRSSPGASPGSLQAVSRTQPLFLLPHTARSVPCSPAVPPGPTVTAQGPLSLLP